MPIDPFFTSKVKDDSDERHPKKVAYAKMFQAGRFIGNAGRKSARAKKAMIKKLLNPDELIGAQLRHHGPGPVDPQRASVIGFRRPRKIWQHRNSHDPHKT